MLFVWHELIVAALCGIDAEQRQEIIVGGEDLAFLQNAVVVGRGAEGRAEQEKQQGNSYGEEPYPNPPP